MNTQKHFYALFLLLFAYASIHGEIRKVTSINQALGVLNKANTHTLVVTDIDQVLLEPCNTLIKYARYYDAPPGHNPYTELEAYIKQKSLSNPYYVQQFWSAVWKQIPVTCIETITPSIIRDLQKRNIKIIALTAPPIKEPFALNDISKKRREQLLSLCIDFSKSFGSTYIEFKNLKPLYGIYPTFDHGVIYQASMGGTTKGQVLAAFLDAINWRPKQIIFFDDTLYNLESVEKEMKKRSIPCICFWYQAPYKPSASTERIAQAQLEYFKKYGILLRDREAQELFEKEAKNVSIKNIFQHMFA